MDLKRMHPLLPATTATEYGHRAGIGLERHRHAPGVVLSTRFDREKGSAHLHWTSPPPGGAEQLDRHRITEDAAEAIALALVHGVRGWVVRRRLQRGESADWLLHDPEARLVALEISGVGEEDDSQRLRRKLEQVRTATVARQRVACVVELRHPRATVATA
ncbi:MAG TPA: hypothetical protein VIC87_06150 [Vicinamibacteria bacterium]